MVDVEAPVSDTDALDLPGDLTDRELEVAMLAARGASAPAIAERLFISPRTVHTHLQRAYRKLDVHDRDALAARLHIIR